jgi:amidophosphoribosyltransferase
MHSHRAMGLVQDVFRPDTIPKLPGASAIGHVRYSTAGMSSHVRNAQPFAVEFTAASLAIAHNGNLTNTDAAPASSTPTGAIFQTDGHRDLRCTCSRASRGPLVDRVIHALRHRRGRLLAC